MSAFDDRLNSLIVGADSQPGLIALSFRACWFYDFPGAPTYLWAGPGRLITPDGREWFGTVDQKGRNHHKTPPLTDGRDGASVQVKFELPYLDAATYEGLRDDRDLVNGTLVTAYLCLFLEGEGLRPTTPLKFFRHYTLQSSSFREGRADNARDGVKTYSVTAIGKNGNVGRSQMAGGTMTDPSQRQRAEYWGEAPDYGAGFVIELANATRQFP